MEIKIKVCSRCEVDKEIALFSKDKRRNDGLDTYCKTCRQLGRKSYYEQNTEHCKQLTKTWKSNNSARDTSNKEAWVADNKERHAIYQQEYIKNRYNNDIEYKLRRRLRTRLGSAINNDYKSGSAVRDLGCSIEELKAHLESKFQPGMTWDNWGSTGWHIDHIIPLSSFDLTNREELLKACHYSNLQPLWAEDNLVKGDKLPA